MKHDSDERNIADLCRPLSAKVMPQRFKYSVSGREMSAERQVDAQRKASEVTRFKKRKKK